MSKIINWIAYGLYLLIFGPFLLLALAYCKITGREKI
jgi:hypothetical protein